MSKIFKEECNYKSITDLSAYRRFDRMSERKPLAVMLYDNRTNGRNFTLLKEDPNPVAFLIGVIGYTGVGNIHDNHAISAFLEDEILYCFNAWGKTHLPVDDIVWDVLKDAVGAKRIVKYMGPSLQADNSVGVCVAFASNFLSIMMKKKKKTISNFNKFIVNELGSGTGVFMGITVEELAKNVLSGYIPVRRGSRSDNNFNTDTRRKKRNNVSKITSALSALSLGNNNRMNINN